MRVVEGAASEGARPAVAELTTLEFVAGWADEQGAVSPQLRTPVGALSLPEVALVTRHVARLFGDRPLGGITFGELARLPGMLQDAGMSPGLARDACRALGGALHTAIADRGPRRLAPQPPDG